MVRFLNHIELKIYIKPVPILTQCRFREAHAELATLPLYKYYRTLRSRKVAEVITFRKLFVGSLFYLRGKTINFLFLLSSTFIIYNRTSKFQLYTKKKKRKNNMMGNKNLLLSILWDFFFSQFSLPIKFLRSVQLY